MTRAAGDPMDIVRERAAAAGDGDYGGFVARKPFSLYERRVAELGLAGLGAVADVGCGHGHWTAALARANRFAVGVDPNPARLAVAAALAAALDLANARFLRGDAGALPFPDRSLDGLLCYGTLMFLDRGAALEEFRRVLRPGAPLCACTNAAGWWLSLVLSPRRLGTGVRRSAWRALTRGAGGSPPNATSRARARASLSPDRWCEVECALEGRLGCPPGAAPAASYAGTFLGLDAVIEFRARRKPDLPRDAGAALAAVLDGASARGRFDDPVALHRHPQPRPALDVAENHDRAAVARARAEAGALDRAAALRGLFRRLGAGTPSPLGRVRACTAFVRRHLFHSFAGQPMRAPGIPVADPVALLLLGEGRCGAAARLLVDLLECGGIPARLVAAGGHTTAEALVDGRWILCDANLYPPGILPLDEDGRPLTLVAASRHPELLDRPPNYVNYHHERVDEFLAAHPETEPALGAFLRAPILPSSGLFGDAFFTSSGRAPLVERLRKTGGPDRWNGDPEFGWDGPFERETLAVGPVPVRHRPGQVTAVDLAGDAVRWREPFRAPGTPAVTYRLAVSDLPPAWEWDHLVAGCPFDAPGTLFEAGEPCHPLGPLRRAGRWLRIVAAVSDWDGARPFYLPSRTFDLG